MLLNRPARFKLACAVHANGSTWFNLASENIASFKYVQDGLAYLKQKLNKFLVVEKSNVFFSLIFKERRKFLSNI